MSIYAGISEEERNRLAVGAVGVPSSSSNSNNAHNVEDEESDEEGSEEEEEEEEEEPKLKYQRIGANTSEILKTDAASCMAVHEKFLALGTHYGLVYVLDFHGDIIRRYAQHQATVNEICIEETGEYIASCGNDGKVCINGLYSNETVEHSYKRPVNSVALDPDYVRKKTNQFVCGGRAGQLILNTKGFLGFSSKNTVLHAGEGPIYAIKWRGSLIAWANDMGVKIYDCHLNQRISYIDRPKASPRPDLYRCCLSWENDSTLIIGWADSVKIGRVKERANVPAGLPNRYVEIIMNYQTDYYISGISPFGEYLIALAFIEHDPEAPPPSVNGRVASNRPELRIITRGDESEEISSDCLTIHGYEEYKAGDYRLHQASADSLFYIVSPKDIVVAWPRDLDDHLRWLLERNRFEEALKAAEENERQMKQHKLVEIGEKYLSHLIKTGSVEQAAQLCPKILKRDPALWENWIYKFAEIRHLRAISPYIPIGNPQLSETVYELVLNNFLHSDHEGFLRMISEWPSHLYKIQNIIAAVEDKVKHATDAWILMDALAQLYTYSKQFDRTLHILLRLKRGKPFALIREHNLYDSIQDKVVLLMEFDMKEAVNLLVNSTERIPIPAVVAQLNDHPLFLHHYLHAIFVKDVQMGAEYHELQVPLYAEFDYKLLGPFLRQSNYYPLEKALRVCEERKLYPEMVYLLGRMGNNKQALTLLIEKVGDVKEAIDFVQSQNDDELWEGLISHSLNNPNFVSGLLENIGAHVDPIKLIQRIPNGMEIIGLRNRLVKIISDYNLQTSLREGCNTILKADCVDLMERLVHALKTSQQVDTTSKCALCAGSIVPLQEPGGIFIFFCGHTYHNRCLRSSFQTPLNPSGAPGGPGGPQTGVIQTKPNLLQPPPGTGGAGGGDGKKGKGGPAGEEEQFWCTICNQKVNNPSAFGGTGR